MPDLWKYYGLARSLLIYYGRPFRIRRLAALYGQFLNPGDLCFDVGAHVGTHTRAMRRLGARVIAVEPQPVFFRFLQSTLSWDTNVTLVESAAGDSAGRLPLHLSRKTPTVSSLSDDWIRQVSPTRQFAQVRWEESVEVEVITLDSLISRFGLPQFCKIDVEGFEPEVLGGLHHPIPSISFEFIPGETDRLLACIDRLAGLGDYRYNWSIEEEMRLASPNWVSPSDLAEKFRTLRSAGLVDIFACRGTQER